VTLRKNLVNATITINVGSEKNAKKIVEALLPETKSTTTSRFKVAVKKNGKFVILFFRSSDLVALRASINSFCRWVKMLNEVFNVLKELP